MSRSKWKGPYLFETKNFNNKQINISRNSEIIPKFLGLTFYTHNGKDLTEITITNEMLGHKFGEFAFTRAKFLFKQKTKKNR